MPTPISVPTVATGDVFTAAMYNSYTRDNLNFLLDYGADLVSAGTLPAPTNLTHNVTGTTTINQITNPAGGPKTGQALRLVFLSTITLTHNAAPPAGTKAMWLAAQGNASITANTIVEFLYDGTYWREVSRSFSGVTSYRKTTAKAVASTTAATDLLNGEITIPANVLGTNRCLRLRVWGDTLQNSGAATNTPRYVLVFGGTTIFDTNVIPLTPIAANAVRMQWAFTFDMIELGGTASQAWTALGSHILPAAWGGGAGVSFSTGLGLYDNKVPYGHANTFGFVGQNNLTSVNVTADAALQLNVINPVNNVNFESRLLGALVEIV